MAIFTNIPKIQYEGAKSKNPLAFKYYDADKVIMGKKMKEHLPFAMAWWHNLCAGGTDMFGRDTVTRLLARKRERWNTRKPKWMRDLSLCKSSASNIFVSTT